MFKKAGKVIFAEPCQTGNLLQSKVFRKVVADIIADKQKFLHIILSDGEYHGLRPADEKLCDFCQYPQRFPGILQ